MRVISPSNSDTVSADGEDVSRQESASVGLLYEIFSARELKAAFAAIAANNLLEGDVLVGSHPVPDSGGDRLAEVFQGLLLPWRIVPKVKRFLGWR